MKEGERFIFLGKDTDFNGIINTSNVILEGSVTGEVHAQLVHLKNGSLVQGEISARKLLLEEGSVHQGKLRMDDLLDKKEEKSPGSPVSDVEETLVGDTSNGFGEILSKEHAEPEIAGTNGESKSTEAGRLW